MRKPFLGLFLLLAVCVTAGQRTPEQAAEIAARFTNQQPQLRRQHTTDRQSNTLRLAHKALQNNSEEAAFYVFNAGYSIDGQLCADDVTEVADW